MSDGSLSQDEIDALLQGTDESSFDFDASHLEESNAESVGSLSLVELNSLTTLITNATSSVGDALGAMVEKKITISNPKLEVLNKNNIINQLDTQIVEVKMDYEEGVVGEHLYFLSVDVAKELSGMMMGQNGNELTEASLSAVSEAMNVISGNASNKIGTKIGKNLKPSPPATQVREKSAVSLNASSEYLRVKYDFEIEGFPPSILIEIYSLNIAKDFLNAILPTTNASQPKGGQAPNMANQNPMMNSNPMMMNQNQGMMNNNGGMANPAIMGGGYQQVPVKGVQFPDFPNMQGGEGTESNIKLLMDVNMELTVELGRTKKSIKEILGMGEGTVIELDKLAGEPVDVLVNGQLIAKGEVVVIDENFGVRVTEIVDPMERLRELT